VLDPFEPVTIMGDEDRLKQLFLILVDNALKYTAIDGQVTVGLRQVGTEYSEIVIRDTGIGIPADALLRVPGVTRVYVNTETEMAYVEYDSMRADEGCLIMAIEEAGFHAGKPIPR
jgi:hypothetical protein